jgi:hypothetical protein
MSKTSHVDLEYERLKSLFKDSDETKSELVDSLIQQASFMKVELDQLQSKIREFGAVQVSSRGAQRQTESAKYYTKLVNSYGTVIKTLNSVLGKQEKDMDDEFDEFLRKSQM